MDSASFDTPILAELFAAQGMPSRAVGILRQVVRERPDDQRSRERLAELEAQMEGPSQPRPDLLAPLRQLVEAVEGATAAALLQADLKVLCCFELGGSAVDVPQLLAEVSGGSEPLRQIGQAQPLCGGFTELTLFTTNLIVVLRGLDAVHLLAMVLRPRGLAGKARYLMQKGAADLLQQVRKP